MRRFVCAGIVAACLTLVPVILGQGYIGSFGGTNYTKTVYVPGETNDTGYLVVTNISLILRLEVDNIGTADVFFVNSAVSTSLPIVNTNPPSGLLVPVGQSRVLSLYPVVNYRAWSAITTNAAEGRGNINIKIDTAGEL